MHLAHLFFWDCNTTNIYMFFHDSGKPLTVRDKDKVTGS